MSKLSPLVRNGIVIAVIVLIAIAVRVFLPTDAGSLSVGQCFDPPTIEGEVSGVDDGPCTDPHKAEVFFVGNYAPETSVFPTTSDFQDFYTSACKPAFNTYTGLDYDTDTTYDLAAFRPTSDSWSSGDRKVICYAIRSDSSLLSTSIKKT